MTADCKVGCQVVSVLHCCFHPSSCWLWSYVIPTDVGAFSLRAFTLSSVTLFSVIIIIFLMLPQLDSKNSIISSFRVWISSRVVLWIRNEKFVDLGAEFTRTCPCLLSSTPQKAGCGTFLLHDNLAKKKKAPRRRKGPPLILVWPKTGNCK